MFNYLIDPETLIVGTGVVLAYHDAYIKSNRYMDDQSKGSGGIPIFDLNLRHGLDSLLTHPAILSLPR